MWEYDEAGNWKTVTSPSGTVQYVCNADNEMVGIADAADGVVTVTGQVEPGPRSNKWYNSWAAASGVTAQVNAGNGQFTLTHVAAPKLGTNMIAVTVTDVSGNRSTQTVSFVKAGIATNALLQYDLNGNLGGLGSRLQTQDCA